MKTPFRIRATIVVTLLTTLALQLSASPLGTAFSYHGQLTQDGSPAEGIYDFRFAISDAGTNGVWLGAVTNVATEVNNGVFVVTLDFGTGVFDGDARWLEIGVRTNGSLGDFTMLSPRQQIAPTPYALYAKRVSAPLELIAEGSAGTALLSVGSTVEGVAIGASSPNGDFAVLGKDNTAVWGVSSSGFAGFFEGEGYFSGNVGIGTDTPAAKLDVNGNVGAEWIDLRSQWGAITVNGYWDGVSNHRYSADGFAGMLQQNGADGGFNWLVAPMGLAGEPINWNVVRLSQEGNLGIGAWAPEARLEVLGNPRVDNDEPAQLRLTGGAYAGALSLLDLATYYPGTNAPAARIQAMDDGNASAGVDILTKEPGALDHPLVSRLHIAAGGNVGIGTTDPQSALHVVGSITADNFSGPSGGLMTLGTTDNQPLELRVNNVRGLRLEYPTSGSVPNLIGGYSDNTVGSGTEGAVVAGGGGDWGVANTVGGDADFSAIGGGFNNHIGDSSWGASIGGGSYINIGTESLYSVIGGGRQNRIGSNCWYSVIAGGGYNGISSNSAYAAIGGGSANKIGSGSSYTAIGGGSGNIVADNARYSTIPGGRNVAVDSGADYALAAGRQARANHTGVFVWADSTGVDFASITNDEYAVRASGGIRLIGSSTNSSLMVAPSEMFNGDDSQLLLAEDHDGTFGMLLSYDGGDNRLDIVGKAGSTTYTNVSINRDNGRVGIGVAAPETKLHVAGGQWNLTTTEGDFKIGNSAYRLKIGVATAGAGRGAARIRGQAGTNGGWLLLGTGDSDYLNLTDGKVGIHRYASANQLEVEGSASKTTAGSWLANSDARIKKDIETVRDALATLDEVRLVSFRYTDAYREEHPSVEDKRYLNVVAQEFAEVFPEHVQSSGERLPDGSEILQVDPYPLTIYSAAAVQELHRKFKEKEAEVAELTRRLARLEQLLMAPAERGEK